MNAYLLKNRPNTSRQSAPFVCVFSESLALWTAVETGSVVRALNLFVNMQGCDRQSLANMPLSFSSLPEQVWKVSSSQGLGDPPS